MIPVLKVLCGALLLGMLTPSAWSVPMGATKSGVGTMRCSPPLLQVPADPHNGVTQYRVSCEGALSTEIAPKISYTGDLMAQGTPPYDVKATYRVDVQSAHGKTVHSTPGVDQVATGSLVASTESAAYLPAQFASQTTWDAASGTLSIEDSAGKWHLYSVGYRRFSTEPWIQSAGMASTPFWDGRASLLVDLGASYSGFASKDPRIASVARVVLVMRAGQLEVQQGDTLAANLVHVQESVAQLDQRPRDIRRAWALASLARYLALDAELHYAVQKVAAFHPASLADFQVSVARIEPYAVLPQ